MARRKSNAPELSELSELSERPASIDAPDVSDAAAPPETAAPPEMSESEIFGQPGQAENGNTIQEQLSIASPDSPSQLKIRAHRIINRQYAGMSVGARTGPIAFDSEGIATVGDEDYELFKRVPGYEDA